MEDSSNRANNTLKVLAAFSFGSLLGATLGILFAPDKGSVTRHKITGEAEDLVEEFRTKMKEKVEEMRAKAEQLEKLTEEKIQAMTKSVKATVGHTDHKSEKV